MSKTKLLIIGYSSFVRRRIEPSLKKNKLFEYCISSKSNKINTNKKILYNNYEEALKKFAPEIVYISTVNSLHYDYAKKILNKGFNVIVDKPVTLNIKATKTLLKIAKEKKLLLAEATLFNYHRVFDIMKRLCNGINQIEHIQSNLNHPLVRSPREIAKINGDCESDMSPYAAAIIRLFIKNNLKNLSINRNYFINSKVVKNFYITTNSKTCNYFGNFSFKREYNQQIIFYTKDKIIYSPQRIFAPPYDKNLQITVKSKNKIKKIKVKKDDCINNFFKLILISLKNKKYNFWLNTMLQDAKIRDIIRKN
jgi:predicted dehydrogenase|tara:strand:- start:98 stop:1024 length:927 start_codon:yes stop_codon:yes gene_type:complete